MASISNLKALRICYVPPFKRFQIFVPTSQASDVGSIPIARSNKTNHLTTTSSRYGCSIWLQLKVFCDLFNWNLSRIERSHIGSRMAHCWRITADETRASSHLLLQPRRNACIPAFGKPSALTAGCSACVRIVVSASGPWFLEWNTRPSCLTNRFSAFIAACPSESTRTTVLYAATFLHGPITPARSKDSSTRIAFLPMSSARNASSSPMRRPDAAARRNRVEYFSRLA